MPEKPGSWRDITASVYCIPGFKVDGIVVNQAPKSSLSTGMWREGSDPRRQQQEGRWPLFSAVHKDLLPVGKVKSGSRGKENVHIDY